MAGHSSHPSTLQINHYVYESYPRLLRDYAEAPLKGSLLKLFSPLRFAYDYACQPHGLPQVEKLIVLHLSDEALVDGFANPLVDWTTALAHLNTYSAALSKSTGLGAHPELAAFCAELFTPSNMRRILLPSAKIVSNSNTFFLLSSHEDYIVYVIIPYPAS